MSGKSYWLIANWKATENSPYELRIRVCSTYAYDFNEQGHWDRNQCSIGLPRRLRYA